MFGDYDRLLNNFGKMATTWIPFFMLEENRVFQPVYVKDVASTVIAILGDAATFGKTFELGMYYVILHLTQCRWTTGLQLRRFCRLRDGKVTSRRKEDDHFS